MVAETNLGYRNSEVPLEVVVHCVREAPLAERGDLVAMITDFRSGWAGAGLSTSQAHEGYCEEAEGLR